MFDNTYYTYFADFKTHDFSRFFEMAYPKFVKSRKLKFGLHSATGCGK